MSSLKLTRLVRQLLAISLVLLVVLGLLPNRPSGTALAFMPTNNAATFVAGSPYSSTHQSMVEESFKELSREFFNISRLKRSMKKAMGQIVDADAEVDALEQFGGTQFNKSASHFDGEAFPESQHRLTLYREVVENLLRDNNPQRARWYLGQALHTLQDFYSHSNWIELGRTEPFGELGQSGNPLNIRPAVTVDTCTQCTRNECPDCVNNLTTNVLTTGYYGGDDRPKPHQFKCSHGGIFDKSSEGTYGSGINKDTRSCSFSPHWELHDAAARVAKEATKQYIRRIKDNVGEEKTKLLFGVGPTLAFAIDTTGSMGSVIAQVRQQAIQIVDSRLDTDEEPSKYVLVAFNDPQIGPVTETANADEFKGAISALTAGGGGDCPEPSMSGTLQALNLTEPGGNLMVFTDAGASDGNLGGNVAGLAQQKNVQVSPMLFGTCSPIDPAYIRVADESGGQLFFLSRSEADNITRLADFNVRSNLVNLLSVTAPPSSLPRTFTVPVDSTMTRVTFSVSGSSAVTVTRPDGTTVQAGDPNVTAVPLLRGSIFSVTSPAPGNWSVTVNNFSADALLDTFNVSVTGESALDFDSFRFVQQAGRPGHEAFMPVNGFPIAGQASKVAAQLSAGQVTTAQFELPAPDGTTLQTLSLEEVPSPSAEPVFKEFFGETTVPAASFLAYVTGLDASGQPYQRLLPGTVKPQTVKITTPGLADLSPGQTTTYAVKVTNLGPAGDFEITGVDDQNFIRGVTPSVFTLGGNQTRDIAVQIQVPPGTPRATFDTLTFNVQSLSATQTSNRAVVTAIVAPGPDLELGTVSATPATGDGDAFLEPGESGTLNVQLNNVSAHEATNVFATLTSTTPGVTVTSGQSAYPSIAGASGASNVTPFAFHLAPNANCGRRLEFTLTVSIDGLSAPAAFSLSVQTGEPTAPVAVSYAGPAVPIPDANAAGVSIPLEVSGVAGGVADLDFSFDGSACTTLSNATTVGLNHSWVGDLRITLTSPQGTTVTLLNRPGGAGFGSDGNNFCQTVFDDDGDGRPIQNISFSDAPHTGKFTPASPLRAFDGENPNGTWTLKVSDHEGGDTGSVRAFSLLITGTACDLTPSADSAPPITAASLLPSANAAGWHNREVLVQLSATDGDGSRVRAITFSATGAQAIPSTTVFGDAVPVNISAEGTTTLTFYAADNAGNVEAPQTLTVRIDKIEPSLNVSAPAGTYLLNQLLTALFSCHDNLSGVATCAGPIPLGGTVDTSMVGVRTFTASLSDVAGNVANVSSNYAIGYNVRLLYDPTRAHHGGSTIPIKLQLTEASGANVSSASIVVTALRVSKLSDYAPGEVEDAGQANPDDNFRFTSFDGGGGYVYNLKTTGLTTGSYVVIFKAGNDPTTHAAQFQIR
jgi:von Willebrand factor A domain-containing protein 7